MGSGCFRVMLCSGLHHVEHPNVASVDFDTSVDFEIRDMVLEFAKEKVAPLVQKMDRESKLDAGLLRQLFEQGYMGIEVPAELGGAGMSFIQACHVVEALAMVDPAVAVVVDIQNTLVNTVLLRYGTEEQKRAYLPRLAGDTVASFCLSEPGSGSDAFALRTTARREPGGGFVLEGTKCWISNAEEAGLFLVFANADPRAGYRGISAFMVERGAPGLTVGRKEDKLGIRASSTCEVALEGVRVPEAALVGELGRGYKIAIDVLNEGRIGIGAQMVGLAQGAFDATLPYVLQRRQFGSPVGDFQGMQFQYAQLATELEAARLMVYNAARLREAGRPFAMEAAMAKLFSSQVAERVASQCVEMHGGVGFTRAAPVEKFYRDAKIGSIYEGTSNMQLQTIARAVAAKFRPQP
eukprot:tig00000711_g3387.t1